MVTVQISENGSNINTLSGVFTFLLLHIQEKMETGMIVIDDFGDAEKHEMKKEVCGDYYQADMGMSVVKEDGEEQEIVHSGATKHPGDEEMAVIAERELEKIEWKKVWHA